MFEDLNPQGLSTAILEIAILLAGAFLIGFIFSWLFFRARAAKRKPVQAETDDPKAVAKAEKWRKTELALQADIAGLKSEKARLEESLQTLTTEATEREKTAISQAIEATSKDLASIQAELQALQQSKADAADQIRLAQEKHSYLEAEIARQKDLISQLKSQLAQAQPTEAPSADVNHWQLQVQAKEQEVDQLRERMRELQDKAANSALGSEAVVQLREKLKLAEEASAELQSKLVSMENRLSEPAPEPDSLNTRLIHKLTQERDQLRKEIDALRTAPPMTAADDLTLIPGITPELQTKLFAQGIRTYAALADLSELDRIRLDRELHLPPGTIKAQKWIKKARELMKGA